MSSIDILKPFHRQFSGSLDTTSVFKEVNDNNQLIYHNSNGQDSLFDSAEELANYYAKQVIAYAGQIISVYEPSDGSMMVYKIVGDDSNIANRTAEPIESFSGTTIGQCNKIPIDTN